MPHRELPKPSFFDPQSVDRVWRVPYQQRAQEAVAWSKQHGIPAAVYDDPRLCLVLVDVQNTFCIPEFELFVAGHSGLGAVEDNRRLCDFIYRNLHRITTITPTMDTHHALQIFHSVFLVDSAGHHPEPMTLISEKELQDGVWRFNPEACYALGISEDYGRRHLLQYSRILQAGGKYALTVWPYHAMLGGIGHALVSAVDEAVFFHGMARRTQASFQIKGDNALTEHYSVLSPEVMTGPGGEAIGHRNSEFIDELLGYDAVVIAGQAKSHCVAWTISDLLQTIDARDRKLAEKVYLLEDCTSPVVVPGVVDYTDQADAAFRRFSQAGMHIVRSTDPLAEWPDLA
jgi:nicotinamidase-related amidase